MKISEVTVETIKHYAVVEIDEDDDLIQAVFMPAAKQHIMDYTHLTESALDDHEDLTLAFIALCAFMYDNRSMSVINDKQNAVIQSFLDAHCHGLVV